MVARHFSGVNGEVGAGSRISAYGVATDPEIAADWLTLTNDRRDTFAEVAEASPSTPAPEPGRRRHHGDALAARQPGDVRPLHRRSRPPISAIGVHWTEGVDPMEHAVMPSPCRVPSSPATEDEGSTSCAPGQRQDGSSMPAAPERFTHCALYWGPVHVTEAQVRQGSGETETVSPWPRRRRRFDVGRVTARRREAARVMCFAQRRCCSECGERCGRALTTRCPDGHQPPDALLPDTQQRSSRIGLDV